MGHILVTGFEPFGGERLNPAAEIAMSHDGAAIRPRGGLPSRAAVKVRACVLPVTWAGAVKTLIAEVGRTPGLGAVVMLGQAGGYPAFGLERVAINAANGRDNSGQELVEAPVLAGGPPAYFSTLPLQAILASLESEGLPAFISNSAGTYLCNFAFYALMHHLATAWPSPAPPAAGFIHVPYLPEQAIGKKPIPPSLARGEMERAVRVALEVVAGAR
ncbi:MAG: pyroglutamyl-peptidase I [Bacillota bacterium]|nr:MAG: pyroglutamyl-peptidase I [Bacillota bacterium]